MKILELPLNLIIKNDEMEDKIIYKKIHLTLTLSLDLNAESSKGKHEHANLQTKNSLKETPNVSSSKLRSTNYKQEEFLLP